MVSTRSKGNGQSADTGDKRSAPHTARPAKKAKKEEDGKLEVGGDGEVGLKKQDDAGEEKQTGEAKDVKDEDKNLPAKQNEEAAAQDHSGTGEDDRKPGEQMGQTREEMKEEENKKAEKGEDEVDAVNDKMSEELDEPKHGTLESGHIYFLYRPKIDHGDDVHSLDETSKFHMLLIPKSPPHDKGFYHRRIEIPKKKMPDPGARHQVIWGLVNGVGTDRSALKDAFGAYSYETKTRGTRHQPAARPAARGHYILHSPRDEQADDPSRDRQRDFKLILAYELTTPTSEDFGEVQKELGLAIKDAVAIQVKDPNAESRGNPRAAGIPKDQRPTYPDKLMNLFRGRRFIPCNPPSFLSYEGTELLIISSPHELKDSLGKDGEEVEHAMDKDAEKEAVGVDEAMKELGLSKGDFEVDALEGEWA